MKFCISKIHLGRYRIDWLDDNNQIVSSTDGGSALVMLMITDWIFMPEHAQYQRDQRKSSDELAAPIIKELEEQIARKRLERK